MSNLDKRRKVMENIRRQARDKGQAKLGSIKKEDLRFKAWEEEIKYESNAVVIAMMDVSGSMGEFKKYIARSFFFWMAPFLRTKYDHVKIVFINHHTEFIPGRRPMPSGGESLQSFWRQVSFPFTIISRFAATAR